MVGQTLGSYRIVSEIGSGGMGVVYLAEHAVIGRKVAVKLLRADMPAEYVERFFTEAKAAAKLHHPGLVDVFDFGHHADGRAFIVMEFLPGESLAERLEREPRLPVALACVITRAVALALNVAHDQGIIHRDLKPGNIFLIPDADAPGGLRTKVLDFGIAKLVREREQRSVKTQSGAVIGTPRYMSPEQCKNARTVDGRSDIYALGCILYEMLLGVAPFDYDSWAELVGAHLYEVPPRPSEIDTKTPADVETLVCKMIEKAPDDRFQTMQELAQSLEGLINAHATESVRLTPPSLQRITATPPRGVKKLDSGGDVTLLPTPTGERKPVDTPSGEKVVIAAPLAPLPALSTPPTGPPAVSRTSTLNPTPAASRTSTLNPTPAASRTSTPNRTPAPSRPPTAPHAPEPTPLYTPRPALPPVAAPTPLWTQRPALPPVAAPTPAENRDVAAVQPPRRPSWLPLVLGGIGLIIGIAIAAIVLLGGSGRKRDPDTVYIVHKDRESTHGEATLGEQTPATPETPETTEPVETAGAPETGETPETSESSEAKPAKPRKPPTTTDLDALTRTFGKQSLAITECFRTHPDTNEQVSVRIQIDARGVVKAAEVLPASVGASPLGACIAAITRKTSFGQQPKPATFRVPLVKNQR